jgi:lipoprotein-releasing system permease protein
VLGGFIGLFIGFVICWLMGKIEIVPGRIGTSTGRMIISYDYLIYVKAIVIALMSSILSSIFPARAAGKLEPMDIIRSGGQ